MRGSMPAAAGRCPPASTGFTSMSEPEGTWAGSLAMISATCSSASKPEPIPAARSPAPSGQRATILTADHFKLDVNVVARGMRVGTDLRVRLADQGHEVGLRDAPVLDAHLDCDTEAAAIAGPDADRAGDLRPGRVLLLLFRDVVERAAEAGGVSRREQMLGRRPSRHAGAAHFLRHRKIHAYQAVTRLGMSVAAAGGRCGCGEERFDGVHAGLLDSESDWD